MSHTFSGACQCNQIELTLHLPHHLADCTARACDCDFCAENDLLYLSEKDGVLDISSSISLFHTKQGSKQAEFLSCVNCEQVVAVVTRINGELRGAVNALCLFDSDDIASTVAISPKALSADEKNQRWNDIWCSVNLSEPD